MIVSGKYRNWMYASSSSATNFMVYLMCFQSNVCVESQLWFLWDKFCTQNIHRISLSRAKVEVLMTHSRGSQSDQTSCSPCYRRYKFVRRCYQGDPGLPRKYVTHVSYPNTQVLLQQSRQCPPVNGKVWICLPFEDDYAFLMALIALMCADRGCIQKLS